MLSYKNNELNLFLKKEENELLIIKSKILFIPGEKHKMEDYSIYYKDYFEDDDLDANLIFEYKNNGIRQEISYNMPILQNSELKTFKFTGPLA